MWQSLLYKKYPPTFTMPTAANFLNLVIDLGSGVNLLREFLGKSYQERIFWVGVFGKGFFGKGFFRKLYHCKYYWNVTFPQIQQFLCVKVISCCTETTEKNLNMSTFCGFCCWILLPSLEQQNLLKLLILYSESTDTSYMYV